MWANEIKIPVRPLWATLLIPTQVWPRPSVQSTSIINGPQASAARAARYCTLYQIFLFPPILRVAQPQLGSSVSPTSDVTVAGWLHDQERPTLLTVTETKSSKPTEHQSTTLPIIMRSPMYRRSFTWLRFRYRFVVLLLWSNRRQCRTRWEASKHDRKRDWLASAQSFRH